MRGRSPHWYATLSLMSKIAGSRITRTYCCKIFFWFSLAARAAQAESVMFWHLVLLVEFDCEDLAIVREADFPAIWKVDGIAIFGPFGGCCSALGIRDLPHPGSIGIHDVDFV